MPARPGDIGSLLLSRAQAIGCRHVAAAHGALPAATTEAI